MSVSDAADEETASRDASQAARRETDPADLRAELAALRDENQRLRRSYVRAQQTRYGRTALGFAALGVLALLGAAVFPTVRTVLLALGAMGLFSALLTYYVTPERFVSVTVGEAVASAMAADREALRAELGLADRQVYVPNDTGSVTLYLPQSEHAPLPADLDSETLFVVSATADQRGVALEPTGEPLFVEFERARSGTLADSVTPLASQLEDALVEQFELVEDIEFDATAEHRLVAEMSGPAYEHLDRIDNPATSFLAVGLARGLGTPVEVRTPGAGSDTVVFEWDLEAGDRGVSAT